MVLDPCGAADPGLSLDEGFRILVFVSFSLFVGVVRPQRHPSLRIWSLARSSACSHPYVVQGCICIFHYFVDLSIVVDDYL
jgi:hypothetical protein